MKKASIYTALMAVLAMLAGFAAVFSNLDTIADSRFRPVMKLEVEEVAESLHAEMEPIRTRSARADETSKANDVRITCLDCLSICDNNAACLDKCRRRFCP